jgi:hypothetical protein
MAWRCMHNIDHTLILEKHRRPLDQLVVAILCRQRPAGVYLGTISDGEMFVCVCVSTHLT